MVWQGALSYMIRPLSLECTDAIWAGYLNQNLNQKSLNVLQTGKFVGLQLCRGGCCNEVIIIIYFKCQWF